MAKQGSSATSFILVAGYDLTGSRTKIMLGTNGMEEVTTPFGQAWEKVEYTGINQAKLSVGGYYDTAALGSNAALVAMNGASLVGCVGIDGNTLGTQFMGFSGVVQSAYNRGPSIGKFTTGDADYKVNGIVEDALGKAQVHFPLGAANSATANGTAIDNIAGSAAGASAYLQVTALALGDRTSLTVKIQDSADNTAWADVTGLTFTTVTAAPAAQRLTTAAGATIREFTRVVYTWVGGATGQTATIMVGFYRN